MISHPLPELLYWIQFWRVRGQRPEFDMLLGRLYPMPGRPIFNQDNVALGKNVGKLRNKDCERLVSGKRNEQMKALSSQRFNCANLNDTFTGQIRLNDRPLPFFRPSVGGIGA